MKDQTIIFNWFKDNGKHERVEKLESELNQQEKDFLMAELIQKWNNNSSENRKRFIQELLKQQKDSLLKDAMPPID